MSTRIEHLLKELHLLPYEDMVKVAARLAELERNEGTLLGMIRHQQDVLRECLPYVNESMAGRRPGRSADDIRAAVKALTTDSAPAVACSECDGAGYLLNLSPAYPNAGREVPCPKCSTDQPSVIHDPLIVVVQQIMARLADLLDDDQFNNIERIALDAGVPYPPLRTADNGSAG